MKVLFTVLLFECLYYTVKCQTGLSNSQKNELVVAHNHFRSIVSPPATNMWIMTWSNELANVAQNYADNCVFNHNDDRTSQQATFFYVGENLAITTSRNVNYTSLVKRWYDEVQHYSYGSNSCARGEVCGHYTQVVWDSSSTVGCGVYRCSETVGFDYPNALILVCNYGPGGNIVGQSPYVSGSSCSNCPEDTGFCVTNLCSTVSNPGTGTGASTGGAPLLLDAISSMTILLTGVIATTFIH